MRVSRWLVVHACVFLFSSGKLRRGEERRGEERGELRCGMVWYGMMRWWLTCCAGCDEKKHGIEINPRKKERAAVNRANVAMLSGTIATRRSTQRKTAQYGRVVRRRKIT